MEEDSYNVKFVLFSTTVQADESPQDLGAINWGGKRSTCLHQCPAITTLNDWRLKEFHANLILSTSNLWNSQGNVMIVAAVNWDSPDQHSFLPPPFFAFLDDTSKTISRPGNVTFKMKRKRKRMSSSLGHSQHEIQIFPRFVSSGYLTIGEYHRDCLSKWWCSDQQQQQQLLRHSRELLRIPLRCSNTILYYIY